MKINAPNSYCTVEKSYCTAVLWFTEKVAKLILCSTVWGRNCSKSVAPGGPATNAAGRVSVCGKAGSPAPSPTGNKIAVAAGQSARIKEVWDQSFSVFTKLSEQTTALCNDHHRMFRKTAVFTNLPAN